MANSKKNILVFDNDPNLLATVRFHLKMVGYHVFAANNPTQAIQMLEEQIIHLAIIGVDPINDGELVYSGLEVAKQTPKHIPFFIYTAYEDMLAIKKRLGKYAAKEILDKKARGASAILLDAVNRSFATDIKVNFTLGIEGMVTCGEIADKLEISSKEKIRPSTDDIGQILRSLFFDAESICISPLGSPEEAPDLPHSGSLVVLVQPRYKNGLGEKRVVKFSEKSEIVQEKDCYNKIVHFLSGMRLAVLGETAFSRQIGGLIYTLIDAEWGKIRTFSEYYMENDVEQISSSLERFFSQTFHMIFTAAQPQTVNLTARYCEGLHLTISKLKKAMDELRPGEFPETYLRFEGIDENLSNPISWILPNGKFRKMEEEAKVCLCHGDLHGRNILVNTDNGYWLIDFARVDETHALRDFVELETDIKFNLMNDAYLVELYRYEHALLAPSWFTEKVPAIDFPSCNVDKSYKVISALRQIATSSLALEGGVREYYEALLFNTLKILHLRHIQPSKKEHALLSAALLSMRLDQWPVWDPVNIRF
jgi:CheY-like chemotaxis protein